MKEDTSPHVSEIIPARDRLPSIKGVVGSIFAHWAPSYEVAVVDDASTVGTAPWLKGSGDDRLIPIILDAHMSRSVARNQSKLTRIDLQSCGYVC